MPDKEIVTHAFRSLALVLPLLLLLSHTAVAQEPPVRQLTAGTTADLRPAWSPDGTRIAYDSYRPGGEAFDVWMIPVEGGTAVQLTDHFFYGAGYPAWSPSGDMIAYAGMWDYPPEWDIASLSLPSGERHLLSRMGEADWHPAWSPDGTQIAFSSERGDPYDICLMAATGEPPTAVRITFGGHDFDPAWSPDGTQIAYHAGEWPGTVDIWVMPATGGPATRLTDYAGDETEAAWSPDGSLIAFTTTEWGGKDIAIVPVAGGPMTRLTTDPGWDQQPTWSPDGTQIAFSSERGGGSAIWIMDLSTLAVGPVAGAPRNLRLMASPNPFHDATTIHLAGVEAGAKLRIVDVVGRFIREIGMPTRTSPATAQTVVWDGRDASGRRVAHGVYFVTIEDGVRHASARVVRVR